MKKILKGIKAAILFILNIIIFIFVNPLTTKIAQGIKYSFWGFYYSVYFKKKVSSHGFMFVTGAKNIAVGNHVRFGRNIKMDCINNGKIIIGDDSFLMNNVHIGSYNKVTIGKNVLIGSNVLIEDHSHGNTEDLLSEKPKLQNKLYSKGEIIIGNNVWIGDNVLILSGVHIGDNSVIGGGSVVTKDVEPNSIYAGSPAKKIK